MRAHTDEENMQQGEKEEKEKKKLVCTHKNVENN